MQHSSEKESREILLLKTQMKTKISVKWSNVIIGISNIILEDTGSSEVVQNQQMQS